MRERADGHRNGKVQTKKTIAISLTIEFTVYCFPAVLPLFADQEHGTGYVLTTSNFSLTIILSVFGCVNLG